MNFKNVLWVMAVLAASPLLRAIDPIWVPLGKSPMKNIEEQFEKLMQSSKDTDREEVLVAIMPSCTTADVSDPVLQALLLKGLTDKVPRIRDLAASTAGSYAERLIKCDKAGNIERVMYEMVFPDRWRTEKSFKYGGIPSRVAFSALGALRDIQFGKLSQPRYQAWEKELFVPVIEGLGGSEELVDRYGTVALASSLYCQENMPLRTRILRNALKDNSYDVRMAALMAFYAYPEEFSHLACYVQLRPLIKEIAQSGSGESKIFASSLLDEFDRHVTECEQKAGVKIEALPGGTKSATSAGDEGKR